jgi:hypothetical protein
MRTWVKGGKGSKSETKGSGIADEGGSGSRAIVGRGSEGVVQCREQTDWEAGPGKEAG